ncbi:MAG TPA: non-canonical purine NTP pyrophosphatase [Candidatus Dormibacteraeota bacterium]|nr:non-canonical purine NTP pyrophosphatase [Candidatus Dormibacteraeota bacterium]
MLVLATRNRGKLRELRVLLSPWTLQLRSLDEAGFDGLLEEPGPGYTESALAKAMAVCAATGLPALADDSGIEVDALHGWPGPMSARWMGDGATDEDRLHGLLAEVAQRTPDDRRARYVCVAALAKPDAEPVTAHGECFGTLVEPKGGNGFGYDPAFLSVDLGITFGEAPDEAKARVSHRARAIARLGQSGVFEPPSMG